MAKGGGGSWKVAYADFVTAMMAFFLVMWIGAQDVKVRQSVANYFVDPAGVDKRPVMAGAILDVPSPGSVPGEKSVANGHGVRVPSGGQPSPGTAAVLEWVSEDGRAARWQSEARRCLAAARARKPDNESRAPEVIAALELAQLLRAELTASIAAENAPAVQRKLLHQSFKEVDWNQAARSLLDS